MSGRGMIAGVLLAAGCGDYTASNGELGRLSYGLSTDYEIASDDLGSVALLTNHPLHLSVQLTEKGREDADGAEDEIEHSAEGAVVETGEGEPGDLVITAAEPGEISVSSSLDGALFDRIVLTFDRPSELDLVSWVRGPYAEQWQDTTGHERLVVEEGGQISFLAIPFAASGERLLGEFTPEVTVEPPELAVPDATVVNVYEEEVWTEPAPVTFFAVEPGEAVFTITDAGNGVSVSIPVTIEPISL
jgi:hypothetical protein